jgi:hypothetical protein
MGNPENDPFGVVLECLLFSSAVAGINLVLFPESCRLRYSIMRLEYTARGLDRSWLVVGLREQLPVQSGTNEVGQGAFTKSSSLDDTFTMDVFYIPKTIGSMARK